MLPLIYKRFIDDLFIVFRKLDDAKYFIKCFNSIHPKIQVDSPQITMPNNDNDLHVDILDITVIIKFCPWLGGEIQYKLITKLFSKACNTHMYLPPFSLHQAHIYPNWIKGEINRIRIICSENVDFDRYLNLFITYLVRRGYSRSFIDPIFKIKENIDRDVLIINRILKNKCVVSSNFSFPLTLFTTYSNTISQIINNRTLLPSPYIKMREVNYHDIFDTIPIVVFRNRPNLSALLTSVPPSNKTLVNSTAKLVDTVNIDTVNINTSP